MDIKLRARLSAYSKAEAVRATVDDIPTISRSDIDGLFPGRTELAVSKGKIDTLFEEDKKPIAVDKATIDTLFNANDTSVGRVSYAAIDSLFNKR